MCKNFKFFAEQIKKLYQLEKKKFKIQHGFSWQHKKGPLKCSKKKKKTFLPFHSNQNIIDAKNMYLVVLNCDLHIIIWIVKETFNLINVKRRLFYNILSILKTNWKQINTSYLVFLFQLSRLFFYWTTFLLKLEKKRKEISLVDHIILIRTTLTRHWKYREITPIMEFWRQTFRYLWIFL